MKKKETPYYRDVMLVTKLSDFQNKIEKEVDRILMSGCVDIEDYSQTSMVIGVAMENVADMYIRDRGSKEYSNMKKF
jgi:predicted nucleotidyltransferase